MGVRFNTDRALFEAFPSARDHVKTEPTEGSPAAFLHLLVERHSFEEAISFCAYLLPRREAVAWGCRCLRAQLRQDGSTVVAGPSLSTAEAWVEAPADERRRLAYDCWETGDKEDPAAWLALGAAWSGGSIVPALPHTPPAAPHLTASMIRVGLILQLHRVPKHRQPSIVREWIATGVRMAEFGL